MCGVVVAAVPFDRIGWENIIVRGIVFLHDAHLIHGHCVAAAVVAAATAPIFPYKSKPPSCGMHCVLVLLLLAAYSAECTQTHARIHAHTRAQE